MLLLDSLPEDAIRRLSKVAIRSIHLIGIAGVFANAMAHTAENQYLLLAISSGIVLTILESYSGWIWFVQLRAIALYIKILLLLIIPLSPELSIPCLIAVIGISGFISHAPSWIRYFSLQHGKVVHSDNDLLG